jgi:hypothetical protein
MIAAEASPGAALLVIASLVVGLALAKAGCGN